MRLGGVVETMRNILGVEREELAGWLVERGEKAYRADQVLGWAYGRSVEQWGGMTNVSAALRSRLGAVFSLRQSEVVKVQEGADGTRKYLLRWLDGSTTETVLIRRGGRATVCVSSQVGCPVRCAFCASGLGGLERSLSAGEIVEQVMRVREGLAAEAGKGQALRVSHVVIMGMGEPLANYDEVLRAVRILNASWGLGIAARHITVSTVGLPDKIRRLATEPVQVTLAVSLHAGSDELRRRLVPWAERITLEEIFEAIADYFRATHREVTLEYVLLDGVNSGQQDAEALAQWARRGRCNVNVINYNAVSETGYRPVDGATLRSFCRRLEERGVNVHVRASVGGKIDAGCGQLRRRAAE